MQNTEKLCKKDTSCLSTLVEESLSAYFKAHGQELPPKGLHARVVEAVERPLLSLCLQAVEGNQSQAADLLGINRNTLRKKIQQYDLKTTGKGKQA